MNHGSGGMRSHSFLRSGQGWLLVALTLTALLHSAGFDGYWIGDDFGNIHQLYTASVNGELWSELFRKMTEGNTPAGSFLRPALQLARGLNWLAAGPVYGGWFAVNWLLHAVNAWLIMSLVLKLAPTRGEPPFAAAALAGLLFGVSPVASEGVYWVAAAGDAWVTFFTLIALHAWFGRHILFVPALLLVALGFKESAGVLPLQLLLLLAIPRDDGEQRIRFWSLGMCMVLLAIWFLLRTALFGDAWSVYAHSGRVGLAETLKTIPGWWAGLTVSMPLMASLYLVTLVLGIVAATANAWGSRRMRWVVPLMCASGGMVTATFLNLGGLLDSGEGGRLFLTPLAWFALAVGVALSGSAKPWSRLAQGLLSLAIVSGMAVLNGQYREMRQAQSETRQLLMALPAWVERHRGTSLLIIPEQRGPLPILRNAQSGLVMPPLQDQALLHRVLPTLDGEMPDRHAQLRGGLLTRIDEIRPARVDHEVVAQLLQPATGRWPEHYACWSWESQGIQLLDRPPASSDGQQWLVHLAQQARDACGLRIGDAR